MPSGAVKFNLERELGFNTYSVLRSILSTNCAYVRSGLSATCCEVIANVNCSNVVCDMPPAVSTLTSTVYVPTTDGVWLNVTVSTNSPSILPNKPLGVAIGTVNVSS